MNLWHEQHGKIKGGVAVLINDFKRGSGSVGRIQSQRAALVQRPAAGPLLGLLWSRSEHSEGSS